MNQNSKRDKAAEEYMINTCVEGGNGETMENCLTDFKEGYNQGRQDAIDEAMACVEFDAVKLLREQFGTVNVGAVEACEYIHQQSALREKALREEISGWKMLHDTNEKCINNQYKELTSLRELLGEASDKNKIKDTIDEWILYWMNQTQNNEQDYQNYLRRAMGVDANMRHDLARRVSDKITTALSAMGE